VTLDEFREGTSRLFSRRIRAQIPEAIQGVWRHIRTDIERHYTGLIPEAVNVDPTLERQVEAARRRSLSALKKLEENTLQALKRRNRTLRDQMLRIEAGVYPAGQPQERTLGVWPWIARYGFDFMDTLFEVIDETDFNHRMVWL
jgi:uncharacterized protein YllA (UPF0747 family)